MPELVINSMGLGTYLIPDCTTGKLIDCDLFSNMFNSTCWGACAADQLQSVIGGMAPSQKLTITPPVAPAAPANLTTVPDTTGQTSQDLSNAAWLQTQANNAAANPPAVPDACATFTANWPWPFDGLSCSTLLVAGLAGAAILLALKDWSR